MAGRPSKPFVVIQSEGKSHRTKAELEIREKSEKALLTGSSMKEWAQTKALPLAHKEFVRLRNLFKKIEKDDALYEGVINRYCLIRAETEEFERKQEKFYQAIERIRENEELSDEEKIRLEVEVQKSIVALDRSIMAKRKMMLDIEKENIMTIASVLRSIPKKPPEGEEEDLMSALLQRRGS